MPTNNQESRPGVLRLVTQQCTSIKVASPDKFQALPDNLNLYGRGISGRRIRSQNNPAIVKCRQDHTETMNQALPISARKTQNASPAALHPQAAKARYAGSPCDSAEESPSSPWHSNSRSGHDQTMLHPNVESSPQSQLTLRRWPITASATAVPRGLEKQTECRVRQLITSCVPSQWRTCR